MYLSDYLIGFCKNMLNELFRINHARIHTDQTFWSMRIFCTEGNTYHIGHYNSTDNSNQLAMHPPKR